MTYVRSMETLHIAVLLVLRGVLVCRGDELPGGNLQPPDSHREPEDWEEEWEGEEGEGEWWADEGGEWGGGGWEEEEGDEWGYSELNDEEGEGEFEGGGDYPYDHKPHDEL